MTFPIADALCWIAAARCQILDVLELAEKGPSSPGLDEGLPGLLAFLSDLCHVQSARAAGEVGRICAEMVFAYNRHPAWDEATREACFSAQDAGDLEGIASGIETGARTRSDVSEDGDTNPLKAGPCVKTEGLEWFVRLRVKLDGCLTGARLAKDRAAEALTKTMIPEALGYPV